MNESPASSAVAPAVTDQRVLSVDALRGFDMFWILGADTLFLALFRLLGGASHDARAEAGKSFSLIDWLAGQLEHKDWAGMAFYDLIFPLFVFLVGVSIVFSLTKALQREGRAGAYQRIFRRSALLFLIALLYSGGFRSDWPDIRLLGVLNRIALAYLFAALLFVWLKPRALAAACLALLLGYWALMAWVPVPDVTLRRAGSVDTVAEAAQQLGLPFNPQDPSGSAQAVLGMTSGRVTGAYGPGHNLAHYLDAMYLPGKKWDTYWDPEGLLSTLPAIATCLLGVFAGLLINSARFSDREKVKWLLIAGAVAAALGWAWHPFFPVVKKIWTSSYVLVAGGYSALLLGAFHWITEVKRWRRWCQPLVWVGANAIALYLVNNLIIGGYEGLAARFAGGSVKKYLDAHFAAGLGETMLGLVAVLLLFALARFLYQRKIFLRL